jgi:predicted nucleic acid-binding protein
VIILDTNVVSELMRNQRDAVVARWIDGRPLTNLYTTITQAEVLFGIELLPAGKRREAFKTAARGVFEEDFAGRILPFGSEAARHYATITAERQRAGRPLSTPNAQIAAIARLRGASVATRNVDDFTDCGITVLNPWEGRSSPLRSGTSHQ